MEKYQLTYAFDALCGWCYGFAPALHRFAADNADRIRLQVLSGGLFTGHAAGPLSAYPHIPDANHRIAQLTGVRFGEQYRQVLSEGSLVMDSTAPAMGLAALRRQAPERALEPYRRRGTSTGRTCASRGSTVPSPSRAASTRTP